MKLFFCWPADFINYGKTTERFIFITHPVLVKYVYTEMIRLSDLLKGRDTVKDEQEQSKNRKANGGFRLKIAKICAGVNFAFFVLIIILNLLIRVAS